ncbi:hypothetical protein ACHAPT_011719 [Fusarium lateritium]
MDDTSGPNPPVPALYQPLNKGTNELRLLEILPSEDNSATIQVTFSTRPFEDARGNFIPFSYVWGDPKDTETISINGIPKKVTKNLADFLRQTRALLPDILAKAHWEKPALFWADAICINQDDIDERNHQVQLMKDIYSSAPTALTWLGHTENASLAAKLLDALGEWLDACKVASPGAHWKTFNPNHGGWMEKNPSFWVFDQGVNEHWEALKTIAMSVYWKRTWTFQEMTLPANVLLIYDSSLLTWSSFEGWLIWVFGLLGLVDTKLTPDYNKDVAQVYCEFVRAWIDEVQNVNFLLHSGHGFYTHRWTKELDLPSWAPNWAAISRYYLPENEPLSASFVSSDHFAGFQAAGSLPASHAYMSDSCRVLTLTGAVCDQVDEMYPAWQSSTGDLALAKSLVEFVENYTNRFGFKPTRQGGSSMHLLQMLFRNAMYDMTLDGSQRLSESTPEETGKLVLCFLIAALRGLATGEGEPPSLDWKSVAAKYLPLLGIPPEQDFSTSWKRDILGNAEVEPSPDAVHWHDAAEALEWAWENCKAEVQLVEQTLMASIGQNFKFVTKSGHMGIAGSVEVGDEVVVLAGCDAPVLRRKKGQHHEYIGPCFVLGLMDGEAKQMVDQGETGMETFELH